MPQFIGLPDTNKVRNGAFFRAPSEALKILRKGLVASAASDNGAITVWRDRRRFYRADRQRFMAEQSAFKGKTQRELVAWLKEELPKIR